MGCKLCHAKFDTDSSLFQDKLSLLYIERRKIRHFSVLLHKFLSVYKVALIDNMLLHFREIGLFLI